MPVYYDYGVHIPHRVSSLFETFNLPVPAQTPAPVMYFPKEPSPVVAEYLARAERGAQGKKALCFCSWIPAALPTLIRTWCLWRRG